MNVLDSSAWLEFFADGPLAGKFSPIASEPASVIVPTIIIYEVFKVVLRERGETEALQAVAAMKQGKVVDVTEEIALLGARASLAHRLPMADGLILATAHLHDATLWTMDEHFKDLPQVRYVSGRCGSLKEYAGKAPMPFRRAREKAWEDVAREKTGKADT